MNAKSIIAAASLLFVAGAAMADQDLSREQVRNDTIAARDAGQLDNSEAKSDRDFLAAAPGTLTRAQVKADTLAAIAAGKLDHNELYDSVAYMVPSAKSAKVEAQLAAAASKHSQQ